MFRDAYRRSRPAGVRQGGAGSADQARRECRRRLCRAGKARRQGRSAEGSGARRQASGLSAGFLQEARGLGGIQSAQARPSGHGLRDAVRAGRIPQHADPRLDPVSPVAVAGLSRRERHQLADHQGREGNRPVDLLARQRARYRRRAVPEENADRPERHARHGLFRPAVSDGRRGHDGIGRSRQSRQGAAHQTGRGEGHLRRPLRPPTTPRSTGASPGSRSTGSSAAAIRRPAPGPRSTASN